MWWLEIHLLCHALPAITSCSLCQQLERSSADRKDTCACLYGIIWSHTAVLQLPPSLYKASQGLLHMPDNPPKIFFGLTTELHWILLYRLRSISFEHNLVISPRKWCSYLVFWCCLVLRLSVFRHDLDSSLPKVARLSWTGSHLWACSGTSYLLTDLVVY